MYAPCAASVSDCEGFPEQVAYVVSAASAPLDCAYAGTAAAVPISARTISERNEARMGKASSGTEAFYLTSPALRPSRQKTVGPPAASQATPDRRRGRRAPAGMRPDEF